MKKKITNVRKSSAYISAWHTEHTERYTGGKDESTPREI